MGIGVIFIIDAVVEYCWNLRGVLRRKTVEARTVEVKKVVRGWWRRIRGSIN
jgi:hypothetical protein